MTGTYWQTIDVGFERFLRKYNINKTQLTEPEDDEMATIKRMYHDYKLTKIMPIKVDKTKDVNISIIKKKLNPLLQHRHIAPRDILLKN